MPYVAIQVGAVSFVDEGVGPLLDLLQEKGRINALFLASHSFDPGTASRQIKGHPLPDHGVQEYDELVGGNFARTHEQYYTRTSLRGIGAHDYGDDFDLLDLVIPEARSRDIQVYCWVTESPNYNLARILPGFSHVLEEDFRGAKGKQPCLNHPDYRNLYIGLYEDYAKSYPIDGIALCSERQGALGNAMVGGWGGSDVACFCPHCREAARERGIDVERARRGFQELARLFALVASGSRPQDGAFVSFWRLLLSWPEILAWESLFADSQFRLFRDLYGTVKAIDARIQVGWHIMHLNSFNPFYRATQDYGRLAEFSDFLKIAVYQHCAGPRFARMVDRLTAGPFGGIEHDALTRFFYQAVGLDEAPHADLRTSAFSGEYVRRETVRAVAGTGGAVPIYPGIGIDVPTGPDERKTEPRDVQDGIRGAFAGGASGVILSRKYSEMRLANLEAAGRTLAELGY